MIVDIINKKRLGYELSYKEIETIFNGYLKGDVKDYQMSSFLMAICINGCSDDEVFSITKVFIDSGEVLSFPEEFGICVDKHSTGGIGDKTTLVVAPIVAACGVTMVKMSGRGLGYTGGTIDKLESIPGFRVNLTDSEIIEQVKNIGVSLSSQTQELVPLDKLIYALRDVTGTVSSIPLIASSIMSKKIASGADKILIDIKVGKGALINTKKDALELERIMKKIGKIYNRDVRCIISNMNIPLGYYIGNSLEVIEAIEILRGREKNNNLYDLCIEISTKLVSLAKNIKEIDAYKEVCYVLDNKIAYNKFVELVKRQGGDLKELEVAKYKKLLKSKNNGIIKDINALEIGKLCMMIGAGRVNKNSKIDYTVGIKLNKQVGDYCKKGEVLGIVYVNDKVKLPSIEELFTISNN